MFKHYFEGKGQLILGSFLVIGISTLLFFPYNEEKKSIPVKELKEIKKSHKVEVKEIEPIVEKKMQTTSVKKVAIQKEEEYIEPIYKEEPDSFEIEDKPTVLYTSLDSSGRYTIKLLSNQKIEKKNKAKNGQINYLIISGDIENENRVTSFPLSLNENYIDYPDSLTIDIKDITREDNRSISCSGNFLSSLSMDIIYQIKIDIENDYANCYINSQTKAPQIFADIRSGAINKYKELK